MEVQITPEPGPEEREAIEAALRRLLGRRTAPAAYSSAWRKTGLRDAVEPELQAGARPRKSFGATRA
jgi:hypothetical protein